MAERLQRYLAIIRLKPDTPAGELAGRIPGLHALLSQIANGESEVAFAAPKDNLFGIPRFHRPAKSGLPERE